MTYDERADAIGQLLRETILPRYTRPDHLDIDTARREVADMIADLNSAWPIMPADRFAATGQALARALRLAYTGRAWPTIAHLAKALKAALAPSPAASDRTASATKVDQLEIRREQLLRWCRGEAPCPAHLITRANLELLARDGLIEHGSIQGRLEFATANPGVDSDDHQRRRAGGLGGATIAASNP